MSIKFDMTACQPGDELLCKNGAIVKYIGPSDQYDLPHAVEYLNGSLGTRTDDGKMWPGNYGCLTAFERSIL